MEPSCSRFTPAEGGARLANTSHEKNLLVADHTTFIALRLLHEEAYSIRGSLFDGKKRSVYITRASRVKCTSYDVNLLTDLSVVSAINYDDVIDWRAELDKKEVVVCTSAVIRRIIEEDLLSMLNINVIIIDSCHLISKDDSLKFIMHLYKTTCDTKKPRILALTYPLFGPKVEEPQNDTETETSTTENENDDTKNEYDESKSENDISKNELDKVNDGNNEKDNHINIEIIKSDTKNENDITVINKETEKSKKYDENSEKSTVKCNNKPEDTKNDIDSFGNENDTKKKPDFAIGAYENLDDFDMYEKLEWKLDALENELCCEADLAEDIDGIKRSDSEYVSDSAESVSPQPPPPPPKKVTKKKATAAVATTPVVNTAATKRKVAESTPSSSSSNKKKLESHTDAGSAPTPRLSPAITKPRELIVEFSEQKDRSLLPNSYVDVENYMRSCIEDVMLFLEDHRYDPMEIYGEDLYDELIKIPDPTIDPKLILHQFLYVLDELGPYAADKAAFALLAKLEKLRIKVPYERHFLLLCICTTVFVKIRCYADLVFAEFESDWEKIRRFSTPKLLRFIGILEKFKPPNLSSKNEIDTENRDQNDTFMSSNEMLKAVENCDFVSLGNEIEDTINAYEANLKDIPDFKLIKDSKPFDTELDQNNTNSDIPKGTENIITSQNENSKCKKHTNRDENEANKNENDTIKNENDTTTNENDTTTNENDNISQSDTNPTDSGKSDLNARKNIMLGFTRRYGNRLRGRGRNLRTNAMKTQQNQQNPDALCGIVFMKEPFMAKILFNLIVDLSRSHPSLSFLSAQYSAIERLADPVKEPKDFETQRKKQEDVLKKFRMHECNLLLATSILEEGIDLPRCNLVIRWDVPTCYRSHALCKCRCRAARASCVLLSRARPHTAPLVDHLATYTQIDQIISRKCGCGIQDEPSQSEEESADIFTPCIQAYTTQNYIKSDSDKIRNEDDIIKSENDVIKRENDINESDIDIKNSCDISEELSISENCDQLVILNKNIQINTNTCESLVVIDITANKSDSEILISKDDIILNENDKIVSQNENNGACVDLGSAIALINRYCGKLPSDTFTRLAPQWWMEKVSLPCREEAGTLKTAYICTLRLPLNCPVKFNIVGHPMPSRILARRIVALQAARILHKSGELDHNLMPISKENFQSVELDIGVPPKWQTKDDQDPNDIARPGTTKRRQYYYKKTARAFTDCEPQINATDEEILKPFNPEMLTDNASAVTNRLVSISCVLQCALPERYNTRGRRLHAPQHAAQALALLLATRAHTHRMQIPQFPVYTRSGEVRVSLKHVPNADTRLSPHRQTRILRFMRFVFSEVLRVRRKGMRLDPKGCTHNNYYVVPTIKTTKEDGSSQIDIDWDFLEVIYNYTENKIRNNLGKPTSWQDDENYDDNDSDYSNRNENDNTYSKNDTYNDSIECEKDMSGKSADVDIKEDNSTIKHENDLKTKDIDIDNSCKDKNSKTLDVNEKTNIGNKHQMNNDNKKSENVYEKTLDNQNENVNSRNDKYNSGNNRKVVKKMDNPFLKPGEVFVFDPEKYKEAVVTPWYRNQDQPQFFLVAEICWSLTPDSAFPSATHTSFRSYYLHKYGVDLTQADQPLLDVDHTSARLNLLTPRYVNRKGVALPVSSERTRRNKRDRLDQKQILLPELCHTHPFPAPLWFATVALPAILYRVNALLIADEIRENVAIEASLGVPKITDPDFQWPPLHFGWSLEEVLNADSEKYDSNRTEKKKDENTDTILGKEESASMERETETHQDANEAESVKEKTINDVLQEKEDAESGFEIGMWSNEMASAIPESTEYDELMEPLPSNLTFCTSASGGTNWCSPVDTKNYTSGKTFSMADSDCSYMSSDFDTDDSDLNSGRSDEETESSGFGSTRYTNAALGVRIEYKTAHEAEAVDLDNKKQVNLGPKPSARDDYLDRREQESYLREGCVPEEYKEKFHTSVEKHKHVIIDNCIIKEHEDIIDILPQSQINGPNKSLHQNQGKKTLLDQLFPYGTAQSEDIFKTEQLTLETLEKNKKILMAELKKTLPESEIKKMNCFSMIDVDTDTAVKHDALKSSKAELSSKKLSDKDNFATNKNVDFDCDRLGKETDGWDEFKPYYKDDCGLNGKTFDFDYQPNLEGHPGPSPSLILQALTMSNANDGINLERLETIGDSFLKLAITTRLYCAHPNVHEGKLSHMRSKQVSNLNLYRLGRNKNLGTLMIASKFEPHDNWLPPCHKPPSPAHFTEQMDSQEKANISGASASNDGCFIPYNLITQHSIPDKSIADCVEALIGAYLLACGPRGALLFMCWLGLTVLPTLSEDTQPQIPKRSRCHSETDDGSVASDNEGSDDISARCTKIKRATGCKPQPIDHNGEPWGRPMFSSGLPQADKKKKLEVDTRLGYEVLEETLQYRFRDRSLLLQSMTHASHQTNRLTDCYQRLEFLGDAILDYLITRHLFLDARRHSPGALTDLRSALVNNTIFATLAVRHHFHKFFRHMSPGLNEVLTKYVKIQEENGHSISEEHYLIQEDEMEQAEDVEVPKALGDLFESVAGAIFLDSGMSLSAVWRSYERLMRLELEAFSAAAPKSPVRELLEQEPDTAKFGKPERLADGRRVRVKVEVFGRGTFKGIGRNYRIAKGTAARCALRHLKSYNNR